MDTQTQDRVISPDEADKIFGIDISDNDVTESGSGLQDIVNTAVDEAMEAFWRAADAVADAKGSGFNDALGVVMGIFFVQAMESAMAAGRDAMLDLISHGVVKVAAIDPRTVGPITADEEDKRYEQLTDAQAEEIIQIATNSGALIDQESGSDRAVAYAVIQRADKIVSLVDGAPESVNKVVALADEWGIER